MVEFLYLKLQFIFKKQNILDPIISKTENYDFVFVSHLIAHLIYMYITDFSCETLSHSSVIFFFRFFSGLLLSYYLCIVYFRDALICVNSSWGV